MDKPKYKRGDKVLFHVPKVVAFDGKEIHPEMDIEGVIEIVDAFGTFEQHDEPSYDIYSAEKNVLYKHLVQSLIKEYLGEASEDERMKW